LCSVILSANAAGVMADILLLPEAACRRGPAARIGRQLLIHAAGNYR
jgi:hypothetical protein